MYTDFIFAIFAEDFGLLGCTLFLGFLAVFSYISLRISLKCRNNYTKLVAIGCGVLLTGQSIMHIAVATGSMPTTGLPCLLYTSPSPRDNRVSRMPSSA